MKMALDWVAEYLDRPVAAAEAGDALMNAGLPIESVVDAGGTQVLDVEVTSNRSDCLSHVGLARELAALLPLKFRMPGVAARATGPAVETLTSVAVEDLQGCPYYSARVIQGVKVGPSPDWLVRKLESIGLRAVNNVVDVTNYVLFELGQPLHAFDFDTLNEKRIVVRRAREGETITSIDGKKHTLTAAMLVIADAQAPVAIAGVMGGKATEVTEATTTILLESARFDPLTIRSTARALALASDSSFRFERGIDPEMAEKASLRAAQLITQVAGGTIATGVAIAGTTARKPIEITVRIGRISQVLGFEIQAARLTAILTALGFGPRVDGAVIRCTVPTHRLDVDREIDLIEEIVRVNGYGNIPTRHAISHPVFPETNQEKASKAIRQAILAAGFNETITVTFVDEAEAKLFLPESVGTQIRVRDAVRKASNVVRPSLLPSLLQVRRTNQNTGIPTARLWEHSEVFWQQGDPAREKPTERHVLSLVGNTVSEVHGVLDLIAARLGPEVKLKATPQEFPWYAKGASAAVQLVTGGTETAIGHFGQFRQGIGKHYDLRHEAAGAEILWQPLLEAFVPIRQAKPLSTTQSVRRDLSVVVDEAVRWADVSAAIAEAKLPFLESIDFVVTFRHKNIGEGKKSLTLTLEFRDPASTLRSEQVDTQVQTVVGILSAKFAATLRA
jgi:phenylalanyl-tRNA synthetase beta chain